MSVRSAAPSASDRYGSSFDSSPNLLRVGDDLLRRQRLHHLHRRHVPRVFERVPQRDAAFVFPVVVLRLIGRLSRTGIVGDRLVNDDGGRRVAAIDRRGVDERLEQRADLAVRLRRAIELAAIEAEPADHRANLARAVVDGHERAFDERRLLERDRRDSRRLIHLRHAHVDQVADLEQRRRRAPRPRDALAAKLGDLLADADSRRCR